MLQPWGDHTLIGIPVGQGQRGIAVVVPENFVQYHHCAGKIDQTAKDPNHPPADRLIINHRELERVVERRIHRRIIAVERLRLEGNGDARDDIGDFNADQAGKAHPIREAAVNAWASLHNMPPEEQGGAK